MTAQQIKHLALLELLHVLNTQAQGLDTPTVEIGVKTVKIGPYFGIRFYAFWIHNNQSHRVESRIVTTEDVERQDWLGIDHHVREMVEMVRKKMAE